MGTSVGDYFREEFYLKGRFNSRAGKARSLTAEVTEITFLCEEQDPKLFHHRDTVL